MQRKDFPGHNITIHYNGDYSGNARMDLPVDLLLKTVKTREGVQAVIEVPCEVLVNFALEFVKDNLIDAIQNYEMEPPESPPRETPAWEPPPFTMSDLKDEIRAERRFTAGTE